MKKCFKVKCFKELALETILRNLDAFLEKQIRVRNGLLSI